MLKLKGGMLTKLEKLRTMPNHEIIKEGKNQEIVHYKVHISEGRKHEYFLVDENGTVLRTSKL